METETPTELIAQKKFSNGKHYPMWGGLVDRKAVFIGCTLHDSDSDSSTELADLSLEEWSADTIVFVMHGKDFDCSVNVEYGGIQGCASGALKVTGYQMVFTIEPPNAEHSKQQTT